MRHIKLFEAFDSFQQWFGDSKVVDDNNKPLVPLIIMPSILLSCHTSLISS